MATEPDPLAETAMPERCTRWSCHPPTANGKPPRLSRDDRGFMVCPRCGDSYGRAATDTGEG